jgi:two-component system, NarL family, response regulator LiaR
MQDRFCQLRRSLTVFSWKGMFVSINILIVDDHTIVRQGLRMFLSLDPEFKIVGEAADGVQALVLARQLRPDVVLMDVLMPEMDGIRATAAIRSELPDTQVIALTSMLGDTPIVDIMRAGAIGFLAKNAEADELGVAIRAAAAGQSHMAPQAVAALLREVRSPQGPEVLTERETEVLRLLAQGQANKEIARALSVSDKTIKTHVSNILAKLGVSSRTQAALYINRITSMHPS